MNFQAFTEDAGETPDMVPWLKLLSYSIFTKNVKCATIDSPVIEMIDLRVANNSSDIEILKRESIELKARMLELEVSTDAIFKRFAILVGNDIFAN
jgi:hypothetical protein